MRAWVVALIAVAGCVGAPADQGDGTKADPPVTLEACGTPIFPGIRGREVDVTVDPNDRTRVAAAAMVTPPSLQQTPRPHDVALWTGLARSDDGGLSWRSAVLPGWPGDAAGSSLPFAGAAAFGDPILSFAPDGDLYMSAIILTGLMQYNMVSMRFPGDSLEPTDVTVFSRGAYGSEELNQVPGFNPVAYNDKNDQVVDPESGGWYVSWMWRSNARGMATVPVVSYSDDGGRTWQGPVMLIDSLVAGVTAEDAHLAPAPFILGDSVYVLWTQGGTRTVWGAAAPRDTLDFGQPFEVASLGSGGQASSVLTLPMINVASGPGPGGVGERAWLTAIRTGDGYDIGVWHSDDGRTWQGPITPHNETANAQMLPTIAVAPDGRVASQFIDFSQDPGNDRYYTIVSISDDAGATWSEHNVTSEPTAASQAGDSVQGHVGDYFGNAWTSAGVFGAWQGGPGGTADAGYSEIYGCVVVA